MLNTKVAKASSFNGKLYAFAKRRKRGCAVYGPYDRHAAGMYQVAFELAIFGSARAPELDQVAAIIEIVDAGDDVIIEQRAVCVSEIAAAIKTFVLDVTLSAPAVLEYRVHSMGAVNLVAGINPTATRMDKTPPVENLPMTADSTFIHDEVRRVMRLLQPHVAADQVKVRVGRQGDGGYVQLDDFEGVDVALSFGINDEVSWDVDVADRGLTVYQFDHTVEAPRPDDSRMIFAKRMISEHRGPDRETIGDLITRHDKRLPKPNIMLKMDIECGEWSALRSVDEALLARCSQIICELHAFQNLWRDDWRPDIADGLRKLTCHHRVVHVHGNVHGGVTNVAGVILPNVLEVTFAHRDLYDLAQSDEMFPGALDTSCDPNRPDLFLANFRF